jgi:hypothetical protein
MYLGTTPRYLSRLGGRTREIKQKGDRSISSFTDLGTWTLRLSLADTVKIFYYFWQKDTNKYVDM